MSAEEGYHRATCPWPWRSVSEIGLDDHALTAEDDCPAAHVGRVLQSVCEVLASSHGRNVTSASTMRLSSTLMIARGVCNSKSPREVRATAATSDPRARSRGRSDVEDRSCREAALSECSRTSSAPGEIKARIAASVARVDSGVTYRALDERFPRCVLDGQSGSRSTSRTARRDRGTVKWSFVLTARAFSRPGRERVKSPLKAVLQSLVMALRI